MTEDEIVRAIINKHAEYMDGLDRGQRHFGREAVINMLRAALRHNAVEQNKRVTELIRYNSVQVIDRRYIAAEMLIYRNALDEIETRLGEWLTDNTEEVFEEQPEIDGIRGLVDEAREAARKLKPEDFGRP